MSYLEIGTLLLLALLAGAAWREIVFVEIKTGSARPNAVQRRLEKLVVEGRVRWKELRVTLPTQSH